MTSIVLQQMQAAAAMAGAEECCGLMLGDGDGIDALLASRNMAAERERHFEIDPQLLIDAHRAARAGGKRLIGYYHSHPNGLPRPSATDRAMAAGDGMIWAIVARGDVTFWRDDGEQFVPLPYRLSDG